jgi:3,4-dihydroxy 2-butanone 4-phosphate synthase/GTP cyclohydrolase II
MQPVDWRQPWQHARARGPSHRPFVTAAFALSSDGFLTEEHGRPTAISGAASLRMTHELRAAHDAVLVGRGTQQADDPRLTTRLAEGPTGLRVVLDTQLQLSPDARLVTSAERPVLVLTSHHASPSREQTLKDARVEVARLPSAPGGVSLGASLAELGRRGVRSVMVEGGAAVLESFFLEGLVDFVCLTTAPIRLANPRALPCGPATRAALASWTPSSRFFAGDDVVTAGALETPAQIAVG